MHTKTYPLTGLHCQNCVRKISTALAPLVEQPSAVQVSLAPMQVQLPSLREGVTLQQLQTAVASAGSYQLQADLEEKVAPARVFIAQSAIKNAANQASSRAVESWHTYYPLLLIMGFILLASVLVQLGQHAGHSMGMTAISWHETMRYFMAGFFLVFAFFKLLDLQAFADAYAGYDLLAARWRPWGLIYPFVELGLGAAYLANFAPTATAWVTILVMGFSAIGVIQAVLSQRKIRCACLGAVFNLPMSTVTIVEDVGMVLMAMCMLAQ